MCCCSEKRDVGTQGCCHSQTDDVLWSKAKKIRVLEHKMECFDKKKNEIAQMIKEHKGES